MPQGPLPFQYAEENRATGVTSLSGLAAYLDMAQAAGLSESVRTHLGVKEGGQGWTDSQIVTAVVLLNLVGGESVDDLRMLQKDDGLSRLLLTAQTHRICRRERRALKRRWRRECRRSVPSPSAVFRYLSKFHDASEEIRRKPHTGFIPAPNEALGGPPRSTRTWWGSWGSILLTATLDMDATLIETNKQQALLPEVQGVSAADDILGRSRPDRAFRVQRRQRSCRPSVEGVQRVVGVPACRGGAGAAEVRHSGLPEGVAEVLR